MFILFGGFKKVSWKYHQGRSAQGGGELHTCGRVDCWCLYWSVYFSYIQVIVFVDSSICICRFNYLYLLIEVFAIYHVWIVVAHMHKNIMRNAGATPASALRMGELVPRGKRNNKDVYVISLHHGAGLHNLRLVLISKCSQFFILGTLMLCFLLQKCRIKAFGVKQLLL